MQKHHFHKMAMAVTLMGLVISACTATSNPTATRKSPNINSVQATDASPLPSPSPSPSPSPIAVASPNPSPDPIPSPDPKPEQSKRIDQDIQPSETFNAEIFDPPSNCRATPDLNGVVQKVLDKGDVLIDKGSPTANQDGTWYREKYLNCWIHSSQLQHKGEPAAMLTEPEPSTSEASATEPNSTFIPGTCKELKAQGLGPFYKGDPNYTSKRDRDKDGIACE
jgi:Excalibur calcium-binding domain